MNCYKCKKTIDKMHNDCINNNELQSVLHHIQNCESCSRYYEVMNQMLNDLSSIKEQELPKGFSNKLHFALQRELENPVKPKKRLSTGVKIAALSACSLLLVVAVISILPNQNMFDNTTNMAIEEAAEAPEKSIESDMELSNFGETETSPQDSTSSIDGAGSRNDSAKATEEGEEKSALEDSYHYLEQGNSRVLILDVENIDEVYEKLLELFPDPLPDTSWIISEYDEPLEYKQIRVIMTIEQVQRIADEIGTEYSHNIDYDAELFLEYDNYNEELADLQNTGYVYIVLR